jgi:filamentous hemagglutinin
VVLESTARVSAAATETGGDGGRVEISAARGRLDLRAGSVIDVAGNGGDAGEVKLRALRVGNDVAVTALNSSITPQARVDLEAVRVYNNINTLNATGPSTGTTLSLTTINANDTAFAVSHGAIKTPLGQTSNAAFHIVSGTEVRSTGNLTLGNGTATTDWNLANSTAGGEAGVLTLRAQGNLNINSNLSDGFVTATAPYSTNTNTSPLLDKSLRGGQSWSYRLVAGADATAANPMAINTALTGNLTVAAGKLVRTSSGDIRMAAGGDISLASNTSVVYTAGRQADPLAGFTNPIAAQRAYFTKSGGDIEMTAGRDVKGVASAQLYSNWLFRQGRLNADGLTYASQDQTAWWVRFDQFNQGVGALGGGDVTVRAGNNVSDLSVSAPTQARTSGATASIARLDKTGGGNVTVEAGADVVGGQFYADEGQLNMVAGARVNKPILALGNAQANVRAKNDAVIRSVINPHLVSQNGSNASITNVANSTSSQARKTLFSTYSHDSSVELSSLLGDAVLYGQAGSAERGVLPLNYSLLFSNINGGVFSTGVNEDVVRSLLDVLPANLRMTSYSGNVEVGGDGSNLKLLPAANGQLELLAQQSVRLKANLVMSDKDSTSIPSAARPIGYVANEIGTLVDPKVAPHAPVPVHTGDTTTAKVYAVQGDVIGAGGSLDLSKAVEVRAGRDVSDLNLTVQHANSGDRSLVQAGRDVIYQGTAPVDKLGIFVGGPGSLEVLAGRDVNLGASGGIVSRGDLGNAALPLGGADIRVLAGVGKAGLDAAGTLQRLSQRLASGSAAESDLWLARWLTGNTALTAGNAGAAVAEVAALPADVQRDRVVNFVFTALRETGRDANRTNSGYAGNFDRGYAALELVFPGMGEKDANGQFTKYNGSIDMFASRIATERGGNVDLLVPGGGLVVGLPNTPKALVDKREGVLGVVALQKGDIRAFTRDDIRVNQSRILTVLGGDIVLWSSEGDIDAGKGKKTATSAPPPVITTNPVTGAVFQELQGAASGSGIGALITGGVPAGDVDLIAPKGTVDAGDAGIRAGNLNIAALVVLGANNITVSGTSAGTPVADTSAITASASGATSGKDDTSKVVEALNQAAADSAKAAQEIAASLRPSVVRVDVLGYGE